VLADGPAQLSLALSLLLAVEGLAAADEQLLPPDAEHTFDGD
jgi:hypothetical protein